jgi:hypothetical protein
VLRSVHRACRIHSAVALIVLIAGAAPGVEASIGFDVPHGFEERRGSVSASSTLTSFSSATMSESAKTDQLHGPEGENMPHIDRASIVFADRDNATRERSTEKTRIEDMRGQSQAAAGQREGAERAGETREDEADWEREGVEGDHDERGEKARFTVTVMPSDLVMASDAHVSATSRAMARFCEGRDRTRGADLEAEAAEGVVRDVKGVYRDAGFAIAKALAKTQAQCQAGGNAFSCTSARAAVESWAEVTAHAHAEAVARAIEACPCLESTEEVAFGSEAAFVELVADAFGMAEVHACSKGDHTAKAWTHCGAASYATFFTGVRYKSTAPYYVATVAALSASSANIPLVHYNSVKKKPVEGSVGAHGPVLSSNYR